MPVCQQTELKSSKLVKPYKTIKQYSTIKNYILNISFILLFPFFVNGQDSLTVSKNFHFKDGIYFSFEDFQSNSPTYTFEEVEMLWHTNPQNYLTQMERVYFRENNVDIPSEKIWGMCMDGIPFIKLPKGTIRRQLPTFAAFKLRGKICYFTYPDWRMKKIPIAAYNPVTGYPYLRSTVEREEQVVFEKMLHFETGTIKDFTVDNFVDWIQDDESLVKTIMDLSPEEREEKLFKCLLIYVDRNEARIKSDLK